MTGREDAVRRPLPVGIDHEGVGPSGRVGQVEPLVKQPFVEEPDPPRIGPGRGGAHHVGDRLGTRHPEQGLENCKVQSFIP